MLRTIFAAIIVLLVYASLSFAQDPGMPDSVIVGNLDGSPMYIDGNSVNVPVWIKSDEYRETVYFFVGIERGLGHFDGRQYFWPLTSWDIMLDSTGVDLPDYPDYTFLMVICYCQTDPGCPNPLNTDSIWTNIMTSHVVFQPDSLIPGDTSCMIAIWESISSVQAGCFIVGSQQGVTNNAAPHDFEMLKIYPNPFNSQTTIEYELKELSPVTIQIFDLIGKRIKTLYDGQQDAGRHQIYWDASAQCSGIYFCRISAGGYSETRRMVLLK